MATPCSAVLLGPVCEQLLGSVSVYRVILNIFILRFMLQLVQRRQLPSFLDQLLVLSAQ
jgi:hypothetical protein